MGNAIDTNAKGGCAVITGGGSGIGKGVAKRCLQLGMEVFLVDLSAENMQSAKAELQAEFPGAKIGISTSADVSLAADNERFRDEAVAFFGGKEIAFLHLNAGTGLGRGGHDSCYKADFEKDFKKTIEIDLYSIFHGFAAFVPLMSKDRKRPGMIATTASVAGLANQPGQSCYTVAKHGVTLMTESLHASLARDFPSPSGGDPPLLSACVLCPFMTNTNIIANASAFGDSTKALADGGNKRAQRAIGLLNSGVAITTEQMADRLYEGIKRQIFYIVGYDKNSDVQNVGALWLKRANDLLQGRAPSFLDVTSRKDAGKEEIKQLTEQSKQEIGKGKWAGMEAWAGSKL